MLSRFELKIENEIELWEKPTKVSQMKALRF
jgi:hypothetical protein